MYAYIVCMYICIHRGGCSLITIVFDEKKNLKNIKIRPVFFSLVNFEYFSKLYGCRQKI